MDLPHAVEQDLEAVALAVGGVRLADEKRDELRRYPADRGLHERRLGREVVLLGALAHPGSLRYPARGQRGVAVLHQRLDRRIQQCGLRRGATVGLATAHGRCCAHGPSVPTAPPVVGHTTYQVKRLVNRLRVCDGECAARHLSTTTTQECLGGR